MRTGLIIIFLLLSLCSTARAEASRGEHPQLFYGIQTHAGGVHAHHAEMRSYTRGISPAFEAHLGYQTLGKHKWEHLYNFPAMGIGYYRGYPGKTSVLGRVNSAFAFMEFTTREKSSYSTRIKYSLGFAHFSQFHHPETNEQNHAIGTPFNVHFNVNYSFLYRIAPESQLLAGVSFTHFSNGAYKKPNKGLNLLDINIGLRQSLGEERPRLQVPLYGNVLEHLPAWNLNFVLGMGKMQKTIEPNQYSALSLSINLSRQSNLTNQWGFGVDMFYDDFIKAEAREQRDAQVFKEYLHGGLHVSHDIVFHNLSAIFNLGYYTFYYVKPYKPIYQRVGLRYEFSSGVIAGVSLKTHYAKADFVEWGLGYRIF